MVITPMKLGMTPPPVWDGLPKAGIRAGCYGTDVRFPSEHPQTGGGVMAASWQFRRLRKHSDSRFINWIIRF